MRSWFPVRLALVLALASCAEPAQVALEPEGGAPEAERFKLEPAEAVPGTDVLMIRVRADASRRDRRMSSYSSGKTAYRNVVFFDAGTGRSEPLFPANAQIVWRSEIVTMTERGRSGLALMIAHEVTGEDTNADGSLSDADAQEIVLTGPSGAERADPLPGRLRRAHVTEEGTVVLMMETGEGLRAVFVAPDLTVTRTVPIPLPQ